jgi:hypothetical protein
MFVRRSIFSLLIAGVLFVALKLPAFAVQTVTVFHSEINMVLTTKGSDGRQLGDMRVGSIGVRNSSGDTVGRLDAVLITSGKDNPMVGDETRLSELVFTMNDGSVLIVGGSGHYPAQAGTLSRGVKIERPIKGGSGLYQGARGYAVSTHGVDGVWRHEFFILESR